MEKPRDNIKAGVFFLALAAVTVLQAAQTAPQVAGSETSRVQMAAADSMQHKLDFVKANAAASPIDPRPTIFTQTEINAFFAERRVKMPDGIKAVRFELSPGHVTAYAHVDFDEITASARSRHPLLAIFSGVHDVQVVADASGAAGTARVNVRTVSIDGVAIPRMALEMFIQRWVNPRYPNIRLDGEYHLPSRLDTVQVESRRGVITQR